jgi:membrane-bound ClpP family serine protease
MKNYSATNTIILMGKITYILLYIIGGIIFITGLTGNDFLEGLQSLLGLALILFGFIFMFSTELLSIFRDTAVNTYNTYNLLKLSTKGMVTSDKDKITKEEEELMKKKDEERKEMMRKEDKFMKTVVPWFFGVLFVIIVIVYFTR